MAEFCKQCSIDVLGEDFRDLAGITNEADWKEGLACAEICEGCGWIQVDPSGNCVSSNCDCAGKPGHGLPWYNVNQQEIAP